MRRRAWSRARQRVSAGSEVRSSSAQAACCEQSRSSRHREQAWLRPSPLCTGPTRANARELVARSPPMTTRPERPRRPTMIVGRLSAPHRRLLRTDNPGKALPRVAVRSAKLTFEAAVAPLRCMDTSGQRVAAASARMQERAGFRSRVGGRLVLVQTGRLECEASAPAFRRRAGAQVGAPAPRGEQDPGHPERVHPGAVEPGGLAAGGNEGRRKPSLHPRSRQAGRLAQAFPRVGGAATSIAP
jgi:hypothetical protein